MATNPPVLAADLTDDLKRLKMAGMRRLAPELLVTAKTQRWSPEEFLRTLVERTGSPRIRRASTWRSTASGRCARRSSSRSVIDDLLNSGDLDCQQPPSVLDQRLPSRASPNARMTLGSRRSESESAPTA
jgi:hypothetical protein